MANSFKKDGVGVVDLKTSLLEKEMEHVGFFRWILVSVSIGLLSLGGCGGQKPIKLAGQLKLPPNTSLVETDSVQISFSREDAAKGGTVATVNVKDMSFEIKDIVPGKYKIGVSITPYAGEKGSEKRAPAFEALNKTFAPTASLLSLEVTADSVQSIVVDMAAGSVSKK